MKIERSLKRAQKKKEIKEMKSRIKNIEAIVNNSQKVCKVCSAIFDPKNDSHLDNWRVKVYDQENRADYFCSDCFDSDTSLEQDGS